MSYLKIIKQNEEKTVPFTGTVLIRDILAEHGYLLPHPCGGRGTCKKCEVVANGVTVLSCRHRISEDTVVLLPEAEELTAVTAGEDTGSSEGELCLCLDIGTTTLALALVSVETGQPVRTVTAANPQRTFGADVISRIEHCMKNAVDGIRGVLLDKLGEMTRRLLGDFGLAQIDRMYVAGNTTMLHIFRGVDPSPMGTAPYTPGFIGEQMDRGDIYGLHEVGKVILLPGISAFVGADIVAGINCVGLPEEGGYRLLIDLGTNAEIALFSRDKILCTAAAAGPCFEGAGISCGMSAQPGAIYAVGADGSYSVIGEGEARGLCATGLVDAIALGLRREIIDESGYLEDGELAVAEGISLTQRDVREFQLAKSAIRAATECLAKRAEIELSSIEAIYVAGGFSASLNVSNAAFVGLIPGELHRKFHGINNGSLLGTAKYAAKGVLPSTETAQYVDLSADPTFSELFMEYMMF